MKFIHTADWHFGGSRKIPGYLDRQVRAVETVYAVAEANDVDYVVVAGDIFERADILDEERNALLDLLLRYDREGFHTRMIVGNHDQFSEQQFVTDFLDVVQEHEGFQHTVIATHKPVVAPESEVTWIMVPPNTTEDWLAYVEREAPIAISFGNPVVVVAHELVLGYYDDKGYQ